MVSLDSRNKEPELGEMKIESLGVRLNHNNSNNIEQNIEIDNILIDGFALLALHIEP